VVLQPAFKLSRSAPSRRPSRFRLLALTLEKSLLQPGPLTNPPLNRSPRAAALQTHRLPATEPSPAPACSSTARHFRWRECPDFLILLRRHLPASTCRATRDLAPDSAKIEQRPYCVADNYSATCRTAASLSAPHPSPVFDPRRKSSIAAARAHDIFHLNFAANRPSALHIF